MTRRRFLNRMGILSALVVRATDAVMLADNSSRKVPRVKTFTETFRANDGHWMAYRSELIHDLANDCMLLRPIRTNGSYYCWTSPGKPGQRPEYGLFGDATGAVASVDVGLASGSFGNDSGNIRIFVGYNPNPDQYVTLWSRNHVRASDLKPEGTTIRASLIDSEWPRETSTKNFGFTVDRTFVFSHLSEFGVTHDGRWNGKDDGVLWFDNAAIIVSDT